ncbi:MAG: carbohydrate ABC transporter permease [Planctomycetota bacterium]|nr:carbohydrate ABC transporter permease [Planctomycetota bacterium]
MNDWMRPPWPLRLLAHAITYAAALTMLLPLAWMITTSLKTDAQAIAADITLLPPGAPGSWQWSNYVTAWEDARLGEFYLNSIIVAVVTTVLSVLHNALAGFVFAKLRFSGRRITFALTIATMLLPMQVYFIFAYLICGWLGYVDHLHALIVPFLATAFGIFYMRQSIAAVPDSLLDAGRIDGFTDFELFVNIVLPCIRPAIGALAIFTFMWSWNNFFWPLIVIDSEEHVTLPLAVARLSAGYYVSSWPVQMAAATIITVPTIIVFLLFQRSFVRGLALTGGKG